MKSAIEDSSPPNARPRPSALNPPSVSLCHVRIDAVTQSHVVERVEQAIDAGGSLSLSVVNVAKLVNMRHDALLRASVLSGDLILADGMPLVWLSRLIGNPLPERVAGIDLMFALLALCDRRRWKVFFLGARPETLERVVEQTRRQYPNAVICGSEHGYFSEDSESIVAAKVRAAAPHVLFVAMSSPKKEVFMNRWGEFMAANVCHGVGGSFDVMAGLVRRAPSWMQRTGLEWLYRIWQEPRRMWKRYLVTNAQFLVLAMGEIACRRRTRIAKPLP